MGRSSYRRPALVALVAAVMVLAVPATGFAARRAPGMDVSLQTAYVGFDSYEPDDGFAEAYVYDPAIDGDTFWSLRTFHGADGVADDKSDYVAVTVTEAGAPIWVETQFIAGLYDTEVFIYDETQTEVAASDDHDYWGDTYSQSLYYVAPASGTYYVEIGCLSDHPFEYELFITVGDARRVWGANRYETAAEVSRLQWDNTDSGYYGPGFGPQHIIIANGHNPADALAGGALAAKLGGVLLLTDRDQLPDETYYEIARVTEARYWAADDVTVHVLGGTAAVSDEVYADLQQNIRHVTRIVRHAGADRYGTAVEIADVMAEETTVGPTAYLVNGLAWPDALAVAPVAAWADAPVLMTTKDVVPQVTLDWLSGNGVTDVVIVGGTGVVSDEVFDQLDALYSVVRVAGENRYETAKEIALHGVDSLGMEGTLATLVSGENFADALSAAPLAWWTGAPVLLTPKEMLHAEVAAYFEEAGGIGVGYDELGAAGIGCYVLGGPAAVSDAVYEEFRDLWMALLP